MVHILSLQHRPAPQIRCHLAARQSLVIVNETTIAIGDTNSGDVYTVCDVPHCVADSTLKIELYNISGTTKDYGWRIYSIS